MSKISDALSTIRWPQMTSSKMHETKLINYNNFVEFQNFNVFRPETRLMPRFRVKFDDVQDPVMFNNFGKLVERHEDEKKSYYVCDDYIVRQNFLVRLYELDVHQNASLETLLNYTEETCLNLFQSSGLVVGGFGVSKEMTSQNLIWVIGRIQAVINSYPSWGDIIQVETWCSALGKRGLTCSSRLTNVQTGKKIMRVDSEFAMINQITRRLSKMPEVFEARGKPYVIDDLDPIFTHKSHSLRKLKKLDVHKALHIQNGIRPLWFDLDPNQHVNNTRYISWILEGTPERVRETNELGAIILEYRRECTRENVLKSLSASATDEENTNSPEFDHLLCLENGIEIARARTFWRSRSINN